MLKYRYGSNSLFTCCGCMRTGDLGGGKFGDKMKITYDVPEQQS